MKEAKKKNVTISLSGLLSLFLFGSLGAQPLSSSLLWKVEGGGQTSPSYLFGTIHLYDTAVLKIPKRVFQSIDSCSSFALELDFAQVSQASLTQRILIDKDSASLDILLGGEAFEKLMSLPMLKLMGEEHAKRIKPIFASSYMYIDDVNAPTPSVDQELYTYAKQKGKQTLGLETLDEQLDAVDAIPLEEQADMLREALSKFTGAKNTLNKLLDAYKSQNFDEIEKQLDDSDPSPLMKNELLTKRNLLMAERIDSLIQQNKQPLFTAVGALHLVDVKSIRGVVSLLKEKGYTLTAMPLKF